MVGRQNMMERVWGDLTKTTPSNLSIVGPRYIGKSVFLKALALRAKQSDSPYALVIYWDLGHATPRSDESFISTLSDLLRDAMAVAAAHYSEHRGYLDGSYGRMKEVTDLLDLDAKPILMIWDGLDKPLGQGLLTGHLFGQMRDIFHAKRHKIVTAARATQSELARNNQVYDSQFWNLFDPTPIRFGPFDEQDLAAAVSKTGLTLATGGMRELTNWADGHPLLLLTILNRLASRRQSETISDDDVNSAAKAALEEVGEKLTILWEKDCTPSARDLYRVLVDRGEQLAGTIGKDDAQCLISHGFAERSGNKLKHACRLLQTHVEGSLPDAGTLARLFGTWNSFRVEIRNVLALRLKQIPVFNNRLHRLINKSIDDIPDFPDDCLNGLSQIEDLALDLIWEREFGAAKQIPNDVIASWTVAPRASDQLVKEKMNSDDWRVPAARFRQIGLLQLLTGSKPNFDSKARYVSKDTYFLINAIHGYRNRNEHPEGQLIPEGLAGVAVMTCVELLGCLSRELA
jgi:hypothetical protein